MLPCPSTLTHVAIPRCALRHKTAWEHLSPTQSAAVPAAAAPLTERGPCPAGGLGWAWFTTNYDSVTGKHLLGEYETRASFVKSMRRIKELRASNYTGDGGLSNLTFS